MNLQPGTRLGHYEIETVLGSGGMGTVYRAFDSRLRRLVAIKLIHEVDDAARRVFEEARSASALNHPNVCTIHEVAELGDYTFIVMEHVEGPPLSAVLAGRRLPPDEALDVATQVASAVAHAHEMSVVHGDLKAANILLSPSGRIKVVDFGLAHQLMPDKSETATSVARGTPYAMAPEQLRGSRADARSDVWALGVLLQELCSGTRPFDQPSVAELGAAILNAAPTPPPPHVHPAVCHIIDRCLAKDPRRRYQRAGELLAALEAISEERRALRAGPADSTHASIAPPPAVASSAGTTTPLVGRETELSALGEAWAHACAGRRQLALVAGEPGIGKTRLIVEFARSIGEGATVLLGRCDQEALLPYQPFVEAIDWYARECPPHAIDAHLAAVDGVAELAHLVPSLARRAALTAESVESNPEGQRYRLFEAVAALFSAIARTRPLLLLIEDLHWADRSTLLLLRHLMRSSHEASLCVIATYRDSELGRTHPLADTLADLRRQEGVARIALRGLTEDAVRELIAKWLGREGPPSFTQHISARTEGNPFFVGEVLRHLAETGALARFASAGPGLGIEELGLPEGVREVIGRRLARLSERCNRVLGLASVVGREFSLPVLQNLAELPDEAILDVMDEAVAARVVQEAPGAAARYSFTHALVRETLYGELTAARRARLHRLVARTLEQLARDGDEPLADLAYHYAHTASADDADKAIVYAVRAAERAAAAFALEEAARFYELALQALDLLPAHPAHRARRLDLHFRRGRAFADLGQWAAARLDLEAALNLVDSESRKQRCELLGELSKCTFWMLDVPAVKRYASEELALAESLGRDDLVADAMSWIASVLNAEGDVAAAVEMDRRAIARVGGLLSFGLTRTVISLYHMGLIDEAVERAGEAVASARVGPDPNFRVYALEHLGIALAGAGRYSEAQRAFAEMGDFGKRHGVLPMLARGIAMSAAVHISLGDYTRAEAIAHEARDLARRVNFPPPLVSAGIDLLMIFARAHDPGRAEAIVDDVAQAANAASGWHGWLWRIRLSEARAELALARGDWQEAMRAASECIADSQARLRVKYEALGLIARSRARRALADVEGAIADASNAVAVARRLTDPAVLLTALTTAIAMEGDDALVAEARGCVDRMLANVDDPALRERFLASEIASGVAKL